MPLHPAPGGITTMRGSRGKDSILAGGLALLISAGFAVGAQNPAPRISQPLSPASAKPGAATFTLTVNGTGFVSGSTVDWNGSSRTTTFVNGTRLTAKINSSDVTTASTASVTVVNPAPGGGTSNAVFFQITTSASQTALSGSAMSAASGPLSVAAADFNRDGKLDLAVANELSNSVSILLGNGDGTFRTHVDYATDLGPQELVVGDFNNDGKLDLAVANAGENSTGQFVDTVSVLLGNGDGSFKTHVEYSTGPLPVYLATGDFNGDGKLDLAVVNEQGNSVSILLGNGDGTFQTHVDYSVGLLPMGVAVGDFSGDGKLDLVVANFSSNTVSLLVGNGDGTFQLPSDFAVSLGPVELAAADFNADGKLDLAVVDFLSSSASVLLGNGNGTFQTAVNYASGSLPESIALGDFNGDGVLDLALATDNSLGSATLLLGNGNGTFQAPVTFPAGLLPVSIAAGDFNNDGKLDVATANFNGDTASALLGTTLLYAPISLTFPSQTIGTTSAAQTVTLTNISASSLSVSSIIASAPFAGTNTCGTSIKTGGSCTVSVTFTPTITGNTTGSLTITDGAIGSPQIVSLTGTGTGPLASLSPTSLSFGSVSVGSQSAVQTVTLTNTGNASLTINRVSVSGDFSISNNACGSSLAAGASCKINLVFKPTTTGTRNGTLSVADNASGSPQTASLTGTGIAPQVTLSPTSLAFATQLINTTSPAQKVTLTNNGTSTLTINSIGIPGNFAETNNCGSSVAIGGSCTINVTFTPKSAGTKSSTLSVYDNASGSPQKVSVSGTGTVVTLSPTSLSFGTVKVGQSSSAQTVTLKNTGSTPLTIQSVSFTGTNPGDFSETDTCKGSVSAGGSCTFSVTFTPAATGSRSASLSISDSGGASPQTVPLSGTGN
jgi:FG-GAP-like repeat/Cep192 domain 4/HYDIN/CFA65/VesB-like, Ig-like domain/Abnormal spindle-like microcephaly-assoc'd, ASPM-SPD-2-Hydin